ncbi:MAG: dynamin family protein, partial [Bacillota bacterium]
MREKLLKCIQEGKDVCQKAEIEEQILNRYKNLETKLEDYKLPVPVVGDFSAGKSTLLNSFLGRDVLSTDITPETAIAAEIKYGSEEKIRCHYLDSVQKDSREVALNNINNLEASKLKHIEIYLNIAKLKEYPDLYLVDMPGRDSSYENHNKAILQYLEDDVYYIVVTDVEHGGLKGSILKFIQDDLRGNDLNFSVLINKADKKPPSAVDAIINQTKKRASALAQENVFVGRTSAVDNQIEDLEKILEQINVEDVVVNKFKGELLDLIKDSIEYFDVLLQG